MAGWSLGAIARVNPPHRPFYGWIIVAIVTTVSATSMALAGFNFGLFIRPMEDELGISRATFGWALSARQLTAAATSPVLGRIIDRRGARAPLIVTILVTVTGMCLLPFIGQSWQLVAIFAAIGVVGYLGPGALVVVTPVAKWFVLHRARAMSIVSVGAPVGAVIFIPLTQLFIDAWGWETAWFALAALGMVIVLPLALFIRRQPEDIGLRPDGGGPPAQDHATSVSVGTVGASDEESWTASEAIRTVTFWQLVMVFSLVMLGVSSVGLHRIPHFTDQGISPGLVSIGIAMDAAAATVGTLIVGGLMRRFELRYVGSIGLATVAIAILLTIYASNAPMMFLSMITFGFSLGTLLLLQNFVWADYFGRLHAGGVRGAAMPVTLIFSAAGPPVRATCRTSRAATTPSGGSGWPSCSVAHSCSSSRDRQRRVVAVGVRRTHRWSRQLSLRRRKGPADREKARELLTDAIDLHRESGMPKHLEMAEELLAET